jgi:soluble lytic murein transglycosylase-like protein
MVAVVAAFAVAASPPAPGAPVPRRPEVLSARFEATTRDLDAGVDSWRMEPRPARPSTRLTLDALYQQRMLIVLSARPRLARQVLPLLPLATARAVSSELGARGELNRLSQPRPLSAFTTGPAAPAYRLRAFYSEAQRRFGVGWNVLAAVNYVESAFNKLRNASTAGAQGPMQFVPSTWRAYGLGGDVHDPHDAILGAANYLHANGAPANYRRALYRYNPSQLYVDAVLRYARRFRSDPRAFYVFYSRQVFVRTPHGLVRLTGPR